MAVSAQCNRQIRCLLYAIAVSKHANQIGWPRAAIRHRPERVGSTRWRSPAPPRPPPGEEPSVDGLNWPLLSCRSPLPIYNGCGVKLIETVGKLS
jgi:hypothetical protein